jgi:hypothetical protein
MFMHEEGLGGLVPRAESPAAGGAVVVGAFEPQRSQHCLEPLAAATGTTGLFPTRAPAARCSTVGKVGIEPAFDRACGELEPRTGCHGVSASGALGIAQAEGLAENRQSEQVLAAARTAAALPSVPPGA